MSGYSPVIIGIDASLTSLGLVCLRDGLALTTLIASKQRGVDRLIEIRERVGTILKHNKPNLVVIESYAFGATNQAHQIGELGGVLRVMISEEGFTLIEVTPGQLKQFATGKGNAKKDMVIKEVYKRWGFEAEVSDTADAYVLSRIGRAYLGEDTDLTGFQVEVMNKLSEKYREINQGTIRKPTTRTTRRTKDGAT